MEKSKNNNKNTKGLTFWQVLRSTLMAGLGVQARDVHERDFSRGNIIQFIVIGILMTTLFMVVIIGLVSLVI